MMIGILSAAVFVIGLIIAAVSAYGFWLLADDDEPPPPSDRRMTNSEWLYGSGPYCRRRERGKTRP